MTAPKGEFASLPGGGPAGEACRSCIHLAPCGPKRGRCRAASRKLGRAAAPISDLSAACADFERRPARDFNMPAERSPLPTRAPVNHVAGALRTSTPTNVPSYLPCPEMTRRHALGWLPFLRMCAAGHDGFFCEVDSRTLDAVCAALDIEPYQIGLEPGCRG